MKIRIDVAAMAVFVVAVFLWLGQGLAGTAGAGVAANWFIDTDDLTRAVRVQTLLGGGDWYDSTITQVMGGLVSHWTRASDLVVLAIAWPLHEFAGFATQEAVLYASYVSPLVLLFCFVAAWTWMVRPLARPGTHDWALLVAAPIAALTATGWFAPMRIDHHALLLVWAVLLAGFSLRIATGDHGRVLPVVGGIVAGMAVWVGIEELLYVGCFLFSISFAWLICGGRSLARTNLTVAACAAAGVVVSLLIERGVGELVAPQWDGDRISAFHVLLLVAVATGWLLIVLLDERLRARVSAFSRGWGMAARGAIGAAGASFTVAAILAFQPEILTGGLDVELDPLYVALRLGMIREGQPVFSLDMAASEGWYAAIRHGLGGLLAAIVGIPAVCILLARRDRLPALLPFAIWIGVFLLWQNAWRGWPSNYSAIWLNLFGGVGLALVAARVSGKMFSTGATRAVGGLALMVVVVVAQLTMWLSEAHSPAAVAPCRNLTGVLALEAAGVGPGDVVASFADTGPGVMWRTGATVTSIPNHHYQPGFKLGYDLFTAATDAEARAVVDAGGITAMMVCRSESLGRYYGLEPNQGDTFGKRLMAGEIPAWLTPVEDGENQKSFLVR